MLYMNVTVHVLLFIINVPKPSINVYNCSDNIVSLVTDECFVILRKLKDFSFTKVKLEKLCVDNVGTFSIFSPNGSLLI